MTEEELKGLLDNYIDDSQNAYRDTDREIQKAVSYYLGKPFGNEVSGKSSVVRSMIWCVTPSSVFSTQKALKLVNIVSALIV